MTPEKRYKRRIKLIRPRLQLKLTAISTGVAIIALSLQYLLFSKTLTSLATDLPNDALLLMDVSRGPLLLALGISLAVLLPLSVSVGILTTFRVAGPVHRLESYLEQVRRGERPADCRLREGDELLELCRLVNEATRPLREAPPATDLPAAPARDAA
jgi:hypothetical protein